MKVLILIILVGISSCDLHRKIMKAVSDQPVKEQFKVWHFINQKQYDLNTEEAIARYKIFKSNLQRINEVNSQKKSYRLGINQFSDMTYEEFAAQYLTYRHDMFEKETKRNLEQKFLFDEMVDRYEKTSEISNSQYYSVNGDHIDSPDWSSLYGEPRNQGGCGSCWTFATTGVIEGYLAQKIGKWHALSTQQLVDCNESQWGCQGGHPYYTGPYEKDTGLVLDSVYPYTSGDTNAKATCKKCTIQREEKFQLSTYRYCQNNSSYSSLCCGEDECYKAIHRGPVYLGVYVNSDFKEYEEGIMDYDCTSASANHAVVGVQLTTEFWKVRNSWGIHWGEGGYYRFKVNKENIYSCFHDQDCWYGTVS